MKKIKTYNNYIKESISQNVESRFLMQNFDENKLSIHPDDIINSLEIDDVVSHYSKYQHFIHLCDEKGETIFNITKKKLKDELYIKQSFYLNIEVNKHNSAVTNVGALFKRGLNKNEFDKFLSDLNNIKNKINRVFERLEKSKDVKIEHIINFSTKDNDHDRTIYLRYEVFTVEKAPNEYIKKLYDDFVNSELVKSIKDTINDIKTIYRKYGKKEVDIDINHDDLSSDTKVVMIGIFTDDEIFVVSTINKEDGKVNINHEEIYRSLDSIN
jgi:hypothetical protein